MSEIDKFAENSGDRPPCYTIALKELTDTSGQRELENQIKRALEDGKRNLVIDLSQACVDKASIGQIFTCFRITQEAKADIRFVVSPKLLKTLKVMKVDTVLHISLPEDETLGS